jgi:hypothetical protein
MVSVYSFGYFEGTPIPDPYIPDLVKRCIDLLLYQFKDAFELKNFLSSLLSEGQVIENVLYDLHTLKSIPASFGNQLDIIGLIVGEERNFREDKEYRQAIYTRIYINISHGTPETIILFIKRVIKPQDLFYFEKYPASVIVSFRADIIPSNILSYIESIAPAGVKMHMQFIPVDRKYFGFRELDFETPLKNIGGFGELDFPEYIDGGTISELIINPISEEIVFIN